MILSRGNTEDLAKAYKAWLGAEPKIGPMLKDRGLEPETQIDPRAPHAAAAEPPA